MFVVIDLKSKPLRQSRFWANGHVVFRIFEIKSGKNSDKPNIGNDFMHRKE